MTWEEIELKRLEKNLKTDKQIVLGIAVVMSFIADLFAVYHTNYSIELMVRHPYPEKVLLGILLVVGIILVINILTLLFYFSYRSESQNLSKVSEK